jgi:hypothetical protein
MSITAAGSGFYELEISLIKLILTNDYALTQHTSSTQPVVLIEYKIYSAQIYFLFFESF